MEAEALLDALRGPRLLVVDSNALQGRELLALAGKVNRLNLERQEQDHLRIGVPALVHAERLFQLHRILGDQFDAASFKKRFGPLLEASVEILPFTEEDAEAHGRLLAAQFPDRAAWRQAKRDANSAREVIGRAKGATVDWFIATQAQARDSILISGDRGPEFAWIKPEHKAAPEQLRDALDALLDDLEG